jgi:hypothetical protein
VIQGRAPGTYEYLRQNRIVLLPFGYTLHAYIGRSTDEVGVTEPFCQRLKLERERRVSLEIDEMASFPKKHVYKTIWKNNWRREHWWHI